MSAAVFFLFLFFFSSAIWLLYCSHKMLSRGAGSLCLSIVGIVLLVDFQAAVLLREAGNNFSHIIVLSAVLANILAILAFAFLRGFSRKKYAKYARWHVSDEGFAELVENLNEGLRIIEHGRTTYANHRFCKMTGYSFSDLIGKESSLVFDEENRRISGRQHALRLYGKSSSYKVHLSHKDGHKIPVIVSAQPLFDDSGTWIGACAIYTEISRQDRIERELRDSEEKFKDFAVSSYDRFWEQDENLRFSMVTQPHAGTNGEQEEELESINYHIGMTRWEVAGVKDPDADEKWRKHKEDLENRRAFRDFRYSRVDRHGRRFNWRVNGKPLFDESGEFIGYRGTATEETKEIEALEHLKKAEHTLRSAIQSISEGFALFDSEDRLVLCNKRFLEIFPELVDVIRPGVTFEEIVRAAASRGIYEGIEERELESFVEERMKKHLNPTDRFMVHSGSNRWVQVIETKTDDGGIVGVWSDVTELRLKEQALIQAQKMEAVGQLTGGVAHDFNNLLAVVLGNLELLRNRVNGAEHLGKYIERALTGARRGVALTERLLAFARKHPQQAKASNITLMIGEMRDLLQGSLGESVKVVYRLDRDLPLSRVDRNQFETVLLNLVLNGRDAMFPEGGVLTIRTSSVARTELPDSLIGQADNENYIALSVIDNGSGMTKEVKQKIFEPFFTTKDASRGSGLGMSIVYGFARQSGGLIDVKSVVDEGTTITLFLPAADQGELVEEKKLDVEQLPLARGERVLLVEDDDDVRRMTASLLDSLGYEVIEASDAQDGLVKFSSAKEKIDLLLSDVVLPGSMDGTKLASALVAKQDDLKVLFMSGYTEYVTPQKGLLDENRNLLCKPFRRADLAYKLRAIIEEDEATHISVNAG